MEHQQPLSPTPSNFDSNHTVLTIVTPQSSSYNSSDTGDDETGSEEGGGRERQQGDEDVAAAETAYEGQSTDPDIAVVEAGSSLLYRWEEGEAAEGVYEDDDDDEDWERPINGDRRGSTDSRRSSHIHKHGLTKGQQRKIYGGGKHTDSKGDRNMGLWGVAGLIFAGSAGPTPLLFSHAIALLGLYLFIPLICVVAVLVWFSYTVIALEARYTGSRSWPALTSSVFPHRFKVHRLGEAISALVIVFCSLGKGLASVVGASEIIVQLMIVLPDNVTTNDSRVTQGERMISVAAIALVWTVVPLVILPIARLCFTRRRRTSTSPTTLSLLPAYLSFFLWPTALLILGVRLKTLNIVSDSLGIVNVIDEEPRREVMGLSIWGGLSIIIFALSSHHDTFTYLNALSHTRGKPTESSDISSTVRNALSIKNQWPLAAAIGTVGVLLLHLGFGLVGYLGIKGGGREANLLTSKSLPKDDNWLNFARLLILIAVLISIEVSLESAYDRIRKFLDFATGSEPNETMMNLSTGGASNTGRPSNPYTPLHRVRNASNNTLVDGIGGESRRWDWRNYLARIIVWSSITALGMLLCGQGSQGEGLASLAEIAGCIGGGLTCFLAPAICFIALFHLRRPRSIFITDPSSPTFVSDQILVRKEREVQRRLSGRRIWIDLLLFTLLLPFGVITIVRGCAAMMPS